MNNTVDKSPVEPAEEGEEEYGELLKFTLAGFAGGLIAAGILDGLGFQRSGWGQWLVRTLSGEGESIFEGIYALRQRLRGALGSMAEAYGWGKVTGMIFPWLVDGVSRLAGLNIYGVETFYIPFFYAMSDQIGANVAGLLYLRRRQKGWGSALTTYLRHPVMLASLAIIFIAPAGLLIARLIGFSPTSQVLTAVETIAANLCWIPPLIGLWLCRQGKEPAD